MKIIEKILVFFLRLLFPKNIYTYVINRIRYTREILKKFKSIQLISRILRILFIVLLYIPCLICACVASILQILILLVLPIQNYKRFCVFIGTQRYALNEFLLDITQRGFSRKCAWKRFLVLEELFIKGREVTRHYGPENPDKIFYVIRPYYYHTPNERIVAVPHLLSNFYMVLIHMERAIKSGYIPVVDWQNYKVAHSEENPVCDTENAWEYYWNQLSDYTLEDVYRSKNVILSNMNLPSGGSLPPLRTPSNDIKIYAEKVMIGGYPLAELTSLNDRTLNYIARAQEKLFPPGKKILGVAIRGTSYAKINIGHHPVQPSLEDFSKMIQEKKEEWGADYVFFTNEEQETVNTMREIFGDTLLVLERSRYKNYHIYSDNSKDPTNEDPNPLYALGNRYQTNLDYLTEMVLLSRCDFLLSAMSGGIRAALMWNGGRYKRMEIIDRGTYAEMWEKKK